MQVINFYFNLLLTRDEQLREKDPNRRGCHFFNSFFITKLLDEKVSSQIVVLVYMPVTNSDLCSSFPIILQGYCYANVRRWTRRIDLFELDKVSHQSRIWQRLFRRSTQRGPTGKVHRSCDCS